MEHLLVGSLYGIVVIVPTFTAMIYLYLKFSAPIIDKTISTREGRKKMIVNGLGAITMFVLFVSAVWFMTTDTLVSVGDSLAGY